jgi:ketosteroid isomerase-like protein
MEKHMKTTEQENAKVEMTKIMEQLRQAAERLDCDGILALCHSSGEFMIVMDGVISNYDQFAAKEREALKGLLQQKLTFDPLHIRVLGDDAVLALSLFHQEITGVDHVVTRLKGEVTWIANRVDGGPWQLTYGHARHMLDTP